MANDFTDFYILYPGHPRFSDAKIIEDDLVSVIIQKWQMICFTNKGDLFGDPNFGGDLLFYLNETRLSEQVIQDELNQQILRYISELAGLSYSLKVSIFEDPERFQEWMEIYFQISEYEVFITVI